MLPRLSKPVGWTLAAYLLGLHAVVALPYLERLATAPEQPAPVAVKPTRSAPNHFAWLDPQVPAGASVFLGDSITAGLWAPAVAERSVNYGISGATTADVLATIGKLPSIERAGRVYLAVGVNDVHDGLDGIGGRFQAIAAAIPGPVVWSAVLPTNHPRIKAEDVARVNDAARAVCSARPRCVFVEAPEWRSGYLLDDGVHLSAAGYAAWTQGLRSAIIGP